MIKKYSYLSWSYFSIDISSFVCVFLRQKLNTHTNFDVRAITKRVHGPNNQDTSQCGVIRSPGPFLGNVCYVTYVTFVVIESWRHETTPAGRNGLYWRKPTTSEHYYDSWHKHTFYMESSKTYVTYVTVLTAVANFEHKNMKIRETQKNESILQFF